MSVETALCPLKAWEVLHCCVDFCEHRGHQDVKCDVCDGWTWPASMPRTLACVSCRKMEPGALVGILQETNQSRLWVISKSSSMLISLISWAVCRPKNILIYLMWQELKNMFDIDLFIVWRCFMENLNKFEGCHQWLASFSEEFWHQTAAVLLIGLSIC